jgi:hypothetical protein
MTQIPSYIRKKYAAKLRPIVASRQAIYCRFWDSAATDVNLPWHDNITNTFLNPIRPAVESVRGFLRFPEERRNRTFEKLFAERDGSWFLDHTRDEAFDSRFVCRGLSDTGLRLVYSCDSTKVDLAILFGALWDVEVLDNPATAIGKTAVAYAKQIPKRSSTLRFAFSLLAYDEPPSILIYASRERILEVFSLALSHTNVSRHFRRNLTAIYGKNERPNVRIGGSRRA